MFAEVKKILPQESPGFARESLTGLVLGSSIVLGNVPYPETGSSRLDCGYEVRHSSRLVPQKGESTTGEVRFGTLNVYVGIDDKIDDVCELMKDRRSYILCVNETKRKGSGGAIKRGSFRTYWSSVDQSQRRSRGVGFILSERLSECVNGYECVSPRLLWLQFEWIDTDFYFRRIHPNMFKSLEGCGEQISEM
ncbi:hypothetical protein EVAR_41776_1 [Eumeta japonica]|uniref:Uncharacterized protein n=1 Tax=Eumeta variegata TaxID=151549 RepID=A0A4C1W085_EUMVA|nr:hypothetical protein EVAR_41776_1 [Eumeta japonica]